MAKTNILSLMTVDTVLDAYRATGASFKTGFCWIGDCGCPLGVVALSRGLLDRSVEHVTDEAILALDLDDEDGADFAMGVDYPSSEPPDSAVVTEAIFHRGVEINRALMAAHDIPKRA